MSSAESEAKRRGREFDLGGARDKHRQQNSRCSTGATRLSRPSRYLAPCLFLGGNCASRLFFENSNTTNAVATDGTTFK